MRLHHDDCSAVEAAHPEYLIVLPWSTVSRLLSRSSKKFIVQVFSGRQWHMLYGQQLAVPQGAVFILAVVEQFLPGMPLISLKHLHNVLSHQSVFMIFAFCPVSGIE